MIEKKINRIVYIDFIKVFLTIMVVAHHAGQAYGNTGGVWLVNDNPKLEYLRSFFFFNAAYMMGFYFFISGYFTYHSFRKKSLKKYLNDKLLRLGVPLIFFALLVFGPIHYLTSGSDINYFSFISNIYVNHPPLLIGHLWFVASLLLYSIIYIFIVQLIKIRFQFGISFKYWYPLIYLMLLIPMNVLVRQSFPIDYWVTWLIPIEVAHVPQYLSLFFLGALFNKTGWLNSIKPISSFVYMIIGLIVFFSKDFIYQYIPSLWAESIIESFLCVGLCLGFISIFKIGFNKTNAIFKLLSDNSYGIYLLHLLIVISLQAMLIGVDLNSNIKFILVTIFGVILSCALSYLLRLNSFLRSII